MGRPFCHTHAAIVRSVDLEVLRHFFSIPRKLFVSLAVTPNFSAACSVQKIPLLHLAEMSSPASSTSLNSAIVQIMPCFK